MAEDHMKGALKPRVFSRAVDVTVGVICLASRLAASGDGIEYRSPDLQCLGAKRW
jgi:hypothetical protein